MALPGVHVWWTDVRLSVWITLLLVGFRVTGHAVPPLLLAATTLVSAVGVVTLYSLANHAVRAVFNRRDLSSASLSRQLRILRHFALLLNPLEVLWRFLTGTRSPAMSPSLRGMAKTVFIGRWT
jgi:hypothetical protein